MSTQFLRTYQLLVTAPGSSGSSGSGLDLSQLHFRFQIRAPDVQTPNNATIRIYNPSDNTALQIQKEYSSVIIQVGYQGGDFGQIFQGDIKWVRKGRENNTTKFVEIDAADGDLAYNKSIINQTLDGTSANQQGIASAIGSAFAANNVQAGDTSGFVNTTGGILPRGKVLFGMARAAARNLAKTSGKTWSIQNGVLVWTPLDSYAPGTAVVLTAKTGMIGMPEATENGIKIRCLINPKIAVGGLVQIDNNSINTTTIKSQGFPDYTSINFFADTSADGMYKVIMNEMIGDTRGQDWYNDLTCLAVSASAPSGSQVNPYGGG